MQADKVYGFVGFISLGLHKFHVNEYAAVGEREIPILRFAYAPSPKRNRFMTIAIAFSLV
uniref:Uncharacterized protein n=1 Tax=uncultured Desulfobacterium sp. TaxID=201089 RepID=E1YAV7_9BACT|nr:unknown protein [uncultured Desulfobacterium sp.]